MVNEISYTLPQATDIEPNSNANISIPLSTTIDLPTQNLSIELSFTEDNGFQPTSVLFNITTKEKAKPQLMLTNQTTEVVKQNVANASFTISNTGLGNAENVKIKYSLPQQNVYATDKLEYDLGSISAKTSINHIFSFLITANYTQNSLPIDVEISEKYGKFGLKKTINLTVKEQGGTVVDNTKPIITITQPATSDFSTSDNTVVFIGNVTSKNTLKSFTVNGNPISLTGGSFNHTENLTGTNNTFRFVATDINNNQTITTISVTKTEEIYSVDTDIPTSGKKYDNRYALIIGNSDYSAAGATNIQYAVNDARNFKKYAVNVLGIPDDYNHIFYTENANAMNMKKYIDNFSTKMKTITSNSEFFIYYSGHGVPDSLNGVYLLPTDVTVDYIPSYAISVKDFYAKLQPAENQRAYFFMDACFSGGVYPNAKTGVYRPKNEFPEKNFLIFSASKADQISQDYTQNQHGLFTYFLLKTLKETKGNITFEQLYDNIKSGVENETLNPANGLKVQNPQILKNPKYNEDWKEWKVLP